MAENKYRFKGHGSFTIREGWLNKGLIAVRDNPKVFAENAGVDKLGVGPNMAQAIRYWLRCSGLTQDRPREGVFLTWLGQLLYDKDCYFEQDLSLWLVHCNIVLERELATSWDLFFNQFSYEEFDKKTMSEEMMHLAKKYAGDGKVAETSVESDCEAILHMYFKKDEKSGSPEEKNVSPFGKFQLLKKTGDIIQRKQPNLRNLPEEVVWYVLKRQLHGENSISIEELLEGEDSPGKMLQLKRTGLLELLGRMEEREWITINHTAGLDMVYLKTDKTAKDIIEAYYG